MIRFAAAVLLLATAPAFAESDATALNLGTLLAGEKACGYTYDMDAVMAYVRAHVAADDLDFVPELNTMIAGVGFELDGLTDTALIAECTVFEQNARHYGFMK